VTRYCRPETALAVTHITILNDDGIVFRLGVAPRLRKLVFPSNGYEKGSDISTDGPGGTVAVADGSGVEIAPDPGDGVATGDGSEVEMMPAEGGAP